MDAARQQVTAARTAADKAVHEHHEQAQKELHAAQQEFAAKMADSAKLLADVRAATSLSVTKAEAERAAAAAGREKANAAHDEMIRRLQAERDARVEAQLAEMKAKAEARAEARAREEEARKKEEEARAREEAKEIARRQREAEAKAKAEEEARRKAAAVSLRAYAGCLLRWPWYAAGDAALMACHAMASVERAG